MFNKIGVAQIKNKSYSLIFYQEISDMGCFFNLSQLQLQDLYMCKKSCFHHFAQTCIKKAQMAKYVLKKICSPFLLFLKLMPLIC